MCAPISLIVDSLQELERTFIYIHSVNGWPERQCCSSLLQSLCRGVWWTHRSCRPPPCWADTPRAWDWAPNPQHRPKTVLQNIHPFLLSSQNIHPCLLSSYLRHVPSCHRTEVPVEDREHPGTGIQVGLKQFPSLQSLVRSTWMLKILTDLIWTPKLLPMSR